MSKYPTPVVVVPLPRAQLEPLKVTEISKMFFPLARGTDVPVAPQPCDVGTVIAPVVEIVTRIACAFVVLVIPVP